MFQHNCFLKKKSFNIIVSLYFLKIIINVSSKWHKSLYLWIKFSSNAFLGLVFKCFYLLMNDLGLELL